MCSSNNVYDAHFKWVCYFVEFRNIWKLKTTRKIIWWYNVCRMWWYVSIRANFPYFYYILYAAIYRMKIHSSMTQMPGKKVLKCIINCLCNCSKHDVKQINWRLRRRASNLFSSIYINKLVQMQNGVKLIYKVLFILYLCNDCITNMHPACWDAFNTAVNAPHKQKHTSIMSNNVDCVVVI